jgi:hypothetical protein
MRKRSVFVLVLLAIAVAANAQVLRVDSVTVDSVWNSDSSWYDGNGMLQQRGSRDLVVSFAVIADTQSVKIVDSLAFSLSVDSGRTWTLWPNPLRELAGTPRPFSISNARQSVRLRALGVDRSNAAIKVYARGTGLGGPRANIRFVNQNRTVDLWGNVTTYVVRDISALGVLWSGQIAYGDTSGYLSVDPRLVPSDGIITIAGSLQSGSNSVPSTWQWFVPSLSCGGSYTHLLTPD